MIKVYFPLGPNAKKQAHRGVGRYYLYLKQALENLPPQNQLRVVDQPQDADIIHYTYFDLFFHTLPIFNQAKSHQKVIVTIHDLIPLVFPDQYPPGKRGLLALFQQKLALQKVTALITDSNSSKQDIIQFLRFPAHKIFPVSLAPNPNLKPASQKAQLAVQKRYQLNFPYLLYVGDINYNKNIPQLIKALKFLPKNIHLVCVGKNFVPQPIPEWQQITEQITLSDVSDRVHFLTSILGDDADEELAALYSGAVCYVQPSLYEGFGLPLLEAMQCRTPVICPANSSLIEVGGEHVIYAEGEEALGLATSIKAVLGWSKTKRLAWLRSATKYVATFSWEKVARDTLHVYRQALKGLPYPSPSSSPSTSSSQTSKSNSA